VAVKEVHEEGLKNVVAVMAEDDGRTAFLARDAVEIAAAQARAERAHRAPRRDLRGHHGIGVLIFDPVRHAHAGQELGQHGGRKAGLALIQIAGQKVHRQQAAPFQFGQDRQQGIAVLAARQADQPAVAGADHAIGLDRLAHVLHQPLAQLLELGRGGSAVKQRVDVVEIVQHGASCAGDATKRGRGQGIRFFGEKSCRAQPCRFTRSRAKYSTRFFSSRSNPRSGGAYQTGRRIPSGK